MATVLKVELLRCLQAIFSCSIFSHGLNKTEFEKALTISDEAAHENAQRHHASCHVGDDRLNTHLS
jgi:hypothetical protein